MQDQEDQTDFGGQVGQLQHLRPKAQNVTFTYYEDQLYRPKQNLPNIQKRNSSMKASKVVEDESKP